VLRRRNRLRVRAMFVRAYDAYHTHAFPLDELDPIHCTGRSVDHVRLGVLGWLFFALWCC
jgi:hypothetical protein